MVSADGTSGAWTYNSAELPPGARMVVSATYPDNGTTIVTLRLTGAAPSREYGAQGSVLARLVAERLGIMEGRQLTALRLDDWRVFQEEAGEESVGD